MKKQIKEIILQILSKSNFIERFYLANTVSLIMGENVTDRKIRETIEQLAHNGYPIFFSVNRGGYFLVGETEYEMYRNDIEKALKREKKRALAILHRHYTSLKVAERMGIDCTEYKIEF